MKNCALDHIGLVVGDLHRSVAFYCDLLGLKLLMEVVDDSPETRLITGFPDARLRMADLACPNGDVVELIEYLIPRKPKQALEPFDIGTGHIAFDVPDISRVFQLLTNASVIVNSAPQQLHAPDTIWDGVKVFYAVDPDGRIVEFVEGRKAPNTAASIEGLLVTGLDHAGLIVADIQRSIEFYSTCFGAHLLAKIEDSSPQIQAVTGYPNAIVKIADLQLANGDLLELLEYLSPRRAAPQIEHNDIGLMQFGVRVPNIELGHRLLLERSVSVRSSPVCISAPGSIWHDALALYAVDPDGRTVELIEWPDGLPKHSS